MQRAKVRYERERVLKLLTNELTDLKKSTLRVILQGCEYDEIGYMDGRDSATGEIVPLLVGLQPDGNGSFTIYPIARLYLKQDIPEFEPPDGRGNYIPRAKPKPKPESESTGDGTSLTDAVVGPAHETESRPPEGHNEEPTA
jgi:hypothetical protein